MTTAASVADDITVTTATRTEDEVRTALGVPVEKKTDAPPVDEKKADEPPAATPELEEEADSDAPDPDVSEAARKLRSGRADVRKTRLRDDITLYEDNIRALGGKVPAPLEKKEYANAQAEIDALARRRNELLREFNKTLKAKPAKPAVAAPPARPAAPVAADGQPAAADPNAPTFEFPSFDDWQAKHADKDYTDYQDARTDARHDFNRRVDAYHADQAAQVQQQRDAVTTVESAIETFKVEHPDYDEVTSACNLDALGPHRLNVLRAAMLREGANAPALLYHLATNPTEVSRLAETRTPADLLAAVGEIRFAARTPAPAAAAPAAAVAPAPPAKPITRAPAPMQTVGGSATPTRTAADAANDTEDADEYIARRHRELNPR